MIEALCYKLRVFGIPTDGPTSVFCDNKSVETNSTAPTSILSKKQNAIAYHCVREVVAANIIRVVKVHTKENLADVLAKPLGASDSLLLLPALRITLVTSDDSLSLSLKGTLAVEREGEWWAYGIHTYCSSLRVTRLLLRL